MPAAGGLRPRLLTPDLALLEAAVSGDDALARALGHGVAEGWEVFAGSVAHTRDAVAADPASTRWGPRLFIAGEPPLLVGWGGFKGAPADGAVELGYAVAPAWRRRGAATGAVRAMVDEAWAEPAVDCVLAHTLAERNASVRVLEKAGFGFDGESLDGDVGAVWRWRLSRAVTA